MYFSAIFLVVLRLQMREDSGLMSTLIPSAELPLIIAVSLISSSEWLY